MITASSGLPIALAIGWIRTVWFFFSGTSTLSSSPALSMTPCTAIRPVLKSTACGSFCSWSFGSASATDGIAETCIGIAEGATPPSVVSQTPNGCVAASSCSSVGSVIDCVTYSGSSAVALASRNVASTVSPGRPPGGCTATGRGISPMCIT